MNEPRSGRPTGLHNVPGNQDVGLIKSTMRSPRRGERCAVDDSLAVPYKRFKSIGFPGQIKRVKMKSFATEGFSDPNIPTRGEDLPSCFPQAPGSGTAEKSGCSRDQDPFAHDTLIAQQGPPERKPGGGSEQKGRLAPGQASLSNGFVQGRRERGGDHVAMVLRDLDQLLCRSPDPGS